MSSGLIQRTVQILRWIVGEGICWKLQEQSERPRLQEGQRGLRFHVGPGTKGKELWVPWELECVAEALFDGVFLSPLSWDNWGFGWVLNVFKTVKTKRNRECFLPFSLLFQSLLCLGAIQFLVYHPMLLRIKVRDFQAWPVSPGHVNVLKRFLLKKYANVYSSFLR